MNETETKARLQQLYKAMQTNQGNLQSNPVGIELAVRAQLAEIPRSTSGEWCEYEAFLYIEHLENNFIIGE